MKIFKGSCIEEKRQNFNKIKKYSAEQPAVQAKQQKKNLVEQTDKASRREMHHEEQKSKRRLLRPRNAIQGP